MLRRAISAATALLMLAALTGCWDMTEINERVYVVGIGIDRIDSEYLYSFQTATPIGSDRAMDTNDVSYTVTSVRSDSMARAVRIIERNMSGEINLEHLACIVIGNTVSRENFAGLLEYLYRDPSARRQCIVAAAETSASDLLSADPESGNMSLTVAAMLEKQDDSRISLCTTTLFKLYQAYSAGRGFTVYRVGGVVSDGDTPSLSGANAYDSDGYTGSLDIEQAELMRLFFGRQTSGMLTCVDEHGQKYAYKIEYSDCVKKCVIEQDIPRFRISLELSCAPVELSGAHPGLGEDELASAIKAQLSPIISRSTAELGAAPIGLEDTARQQCYAWYKANRDNWRQIYSRSVIELDVRCMIERTGSINDY